MLSRPTSLNKRDYRLINDGWYRDSTPALYPARDTDARQAAQGSITSPRYHLKKPESVRREIRHRLDISDLTLLRLNLDEDLRQSKVLQLFSIIVYCIGPF